MADMARRSTTTTPRSDGAGGAPPEAFEENIVDIDVADEMRGSYLEYAYSVIYQRAIPDARDGLKPVQRRILYQMNEMGLRPDRGHVKCARVVGDVMGRLHPHGDAAIYDALVRMAQPWVMRLPLVDGHGNFGSLGGDDAPAAYRYTEARLTAAAMEMVASIDEDTVDFQPNYDGTEVQPEVLPAGLPNLLVNGASGIAVGMATNMAPHNLGEVVAAARHLIASPGAGLDELMRFVPGPDLPTGGKIVGLDGIREAYETGRGIFRTRAAARVEKLTPRRTGHRGHRTALQRRPGEGHRPDQGPGRGEEARRDRRREGPHRPAARPASGHRDPLRLPPRGRAGRAVPADADGGDLRHQQRRAGGRPAAAAWPARAAADLRRPPHRGGPQAQRVPAAQAPRPAAPGRGPDDRPAQHRRGDPGHPEQRRRVVGQGPADDGVRAVRDPGPVHPGHAAAQADPLRPAGARARAGEAAGRDRRADRDPGIGVPAARGGLQRAGQRRRAVRRPAPHGAARGHRCAAHRGGAAGGRRRPVPGAALLHRPGRPHSHFYGRTRPRGPVLRWHTGRTGRALRRCRAARTT